MKDLVDIIAETLRERDDRDSILLLVENLYFEDAKKPWWRRHSSANESTNVAHDIVNLKNSLDTYNKIEGVPIKSVLIKDAVDKIDADVNSKGIKTSQDMTEQKDYFVRKVIKANRNYVTAVMLAELIRDEKRRIKYNQLLTYIIPICTALISATAVILAVILTKFWR